MPPIILGLVLGGLAEKNADVALDLLSGTETIWAASDCHRLRSPRNYFPGVAGYWYNAEKKESSKGERVEAKEERLYGRRVYVL